MTPLFSAFWFKHLSFKKEPHHYLRFEKESRYYELRLVKDLLEDWTLIISNGRIKSKLGQSRIQAFATFQEALSQFYLTAKQRYQCHYHLSHHSVEDLIYTFLLMRIISFQDNEIKDKRSKRKSTIGSSNKKQISYQFNDSQQTCFFF